MTTAFLGSLGGFTGGTGSSYQSTAKSAGGASRGNLFNLQPVVTLGASNLTPATVSDLINAANAGNAGLTAAFSPIADNALSTASPQASGYTPLGGLSLPDILMIVGGVVVLVIVMGVLAKKGR